MNDLNTVTIIGRLTRDAELKFTAKGDAISSFSVAVNSQKKEGGAWVDDPSFFDVTFWGKRAESLAQHMTKGKQIGVAGRLKQDRWTDKEGWNRSKVIIQAEAIEILGGHGGPKNAPDKESPQRTPKSSTEPSVDRQDNDGYTDSIPF